MDSNLLIVLVTTYFTPRPWNFTNVFSIFSFLSQCLRLSCRTNRLRSGRSYTTRVFSVFPARNSRTNAWVCPPKKPQHLVTMVTSGSLLLGGLSHGLIWLADLCAQLLRLLKGEFHSIQHSNCLVPLKVPLKVHSTQTSLSLKVACIVWELQHQIVMFCVKFSISVYEMCLWLFLTLGAEQRNMWQQIRCVFYFIYFLFRPSVYVSHRHWSSHFIFLLTGSFHYGG